MGPVDEIKSRLDIVDLVSETVKLRRSGKSYTGFCPFHSNTRTPAFVVFPETGTWRCFGQCNEGGDIFKYVMKRDGIDFPEALRMLAEKSGVRLEEPSPEREAKAEAYDRIRSILEEAVVFYRHQLLHTPPGKIALEYLHHRGLSDETIENFGLGYAPNAWDVTTQYFTAKGYTPQDLLDAGMVTQRDDGGVYDRFRHRVTFPIRDMAGKMSGFGARILNPEDMPKFLNSPQTAVFDKGRLLYGMDLARKAIRAKDQAVIVEGYLDAIALHQAGYTNTVSPMGTALTEDQLNQIKRFTHRIVLALDPDAAGEKATLRGLEIARQTMDHVQEVDARFFDARGLMRSEARLQADLRVTTLPDGKDPDEIVNEDPQEWQRILDRAKPIVVHVMESLAAGKDLDDPKEKSALAAQVLPLIDDVPDAVERDAYRQRLARLLQIDERTLLGDQPFQPAGHRGKTASQTSQGARRSRISKDALPADASQTLETYCLKMLLHQPENLYLVDRSLQEVGLLRLSPQDFGQTGHQVLFHLLQDSLEQDQLEPLHYIHANLPETLQDLLNALQAPDSTAADLSTDQMIEDLFRTILRIRLLNISQGLNQLRFLQEDIQAQGDMFAVAYQEITLQHIQVRDRLDRALRQLNLNH